MKHISILGQISQICYFGSRSLTPSNIFIISMFELSAKFHKNQTHCNFETKSAQVFKFVSRSAISALSGKFHSIGSIFYLWDQIFLEWGDWYLFLCWIVLLGCNSDFLGGYLVVNARYLVVTDGYCLLPGG